MYVFKGNLSRVADLNKPMQLKKYIFFLQRVRAGAAAATVYMCSAQQFNSNCNLHHVVYSSRVEFRRCMSEQATTTFMLRKLGKHTFVYAREMNVMYCSTSSRAVGVCVVYMVWSSTNTNSMENSLEHHNALRSIFSYIRVYVAARLREQFKCILLWKCFFFFLRNRSL